MAYHHTHLTNGPTEGLNNLLKRVKRVSVYRPSGGWALHGKLPVVR